MFDDDLPVSKGKGQLRNLERMSLDELQEYINEMKKEIIRVEAEIQKKKEHMDSVSSVFK